jgi:hypothetical protein
MKRENLKAVPEVEAESAELYDPANFSEEDEASSSRNTGLSGHVRSLRNRKRDIFRWIALAVLVGGVVALAMVQFAIH